MMAIDVFNVDMDNGEGEKPHATVYLTAEDRDDLAYAITIALQDPKTIMSKRAPRLRSQLAVLRSIRSQP